MCVCESLFFYVLCALFLKVALSATWRRIKIVCEKMRKKKCFAVSASSFSLTGLRFCLVAFVSNSRLCFAGCVATPFSNKKQKSHVQLVSLSSVSLALLHWLSLCVLFLLESNQKHL